MIRFLYGADAGNRDALLPRYVNEDLAAGRSVVLLVPEQETVSAERQWLEALSPAAQLSFEVSNFTRLANRVFRTLGGLSYRYATPSVSALFMWRTLSRLAPMLRQYGAHAATDLRLTDRMLSAVAQFKAYLVSPEQLTEASEILEEEDPLKAKLADLALVLAAYDGALSARFDDVRDDVTRAAGLIAAHKQLFANTAFYVTSFTDFTAQELLLLRRLMETAAAMTVTSPLSSPEDDGIHLASAKGTAKRLAALGRECGKRIFFECAKAKKPQTALDYIRRDLFDMNAPAAPIGATEDGTVRLTVAATPYTEAEYIATEIERAVRAGARYRDFVIVVRDATAYTGIIDAALEKAGIPFYLSEKTDITVRPLIKLILFALRIKRYGWQKEDVVGYLKTGLCGVPADDINFFEEYAEVWRICGAARFAVPFSMNPDGYTDRVSARATRILEGANRARAALVSPLSAYFEALDTAACATEMAEATYRFLLSLNVPETMKARAAARLAAGERREAEEETRLFDVLVDALEAIGDVTGEEKLSLAEFMNALMLVFANTDIGAIPTSADEVTVGSAATLRAAAPRYVFVAGLNDGVFPATVGDKGLISDAEKHRLEALGISLSADNATAASDELFYLSRALSLPQERLYLSYTRAASDGRALEPSIGVSRIKALFPTLPTTDFEELPAWDKIFTRETGLEHLRELPPAKAAALTAILEEDAATAERATQLLTPVSDPAACVPPETAKGLFTAASFNPTGLEQFVSCKFAYYCNKILHLREEPTDSLDAAAVGTFIHYVLENTVSHITKTKKPFADYTDDELTVIVEDSLTAYRAYLTEAGGGISPRAAALLVRLGDLAHIVVRAIIAEFSDSLFAPAFFELDLRREQASADITLPDGSEIPLSGKADRVDWYRAEDGSVYLRVADYKTGRRTFRREDIPRGFCLQMPLYLLALCSKPHPSLAKRLGLPPDTRFRPAGVTYLSTAIGNEPTAARVEKAVAMKSALSRLRREGLLPEDEELLRAVSLSANTDIIGTPQARKRKLTSAAGFDALFAELGETVGRISHEMKSGAASAAPAAQDGRMPCRFCGYRAVCRAAKKEKQ